MGHITTRYSGNSTQARNCRFRLLFSAQLFCLCPLPSCSNRTLKHGLFVAFRLLMQAGPCPNFRSLVSADICRFDNATENTQFPLRCRDLEVLLLYRGSSRNFPPSRSNPTTQLFGFVVEPSSARRRLIIGDWWLIGVVGKRGSK